MQPRTTRLLLLLCSLCTLGIPAWGGPGAAIAIVYDTSGSMGQRPAGGQKAKYLIASEALKGIMEKIDAFAKAGNTVQAGIFTFPNGSSKGLAVPFGPWNPVAFNTWLSGFDRPSGGTPIGDAVLTASRAVVDSGLAKKHVVVLTDGENTEGLSIDEGLRRGQEYSKKQGAGALSFYFVAFDSSAAQFKAAKSNGALVLSASNAQELDRGLTSIFTTKILLEEEEK